LTCKEWKEEIKIMEPNKCDELTWYSLDELPENTVDYVYEAINNYRNKIKFPAFNLEVQHPRAL
jgi:hypothetical protein